MAASRLHLIQYQNLREGNFSPLINFDHQSKFKIKKVTKNSPKKRRGKKQKSLMIIKDKFLLSNSSSGDSLEDGNVIIHQNIYEEDD